MVSIVFRTIIIYLFLLLAMRLMGKRQIGELQISELIVTFMLSELAVNPIANPSMPLLHALIPILLLLAIEVTLSYWMTKSNKMKRLLAGSPTVLIRKGKLDQKALSDNRLEIDELLSELRQGGFADPGEVEYAILEENGKVSVFPKSAYSPITCQDAGYKTAERGIAHPVIVDGEIMETELQHAGKSRKWLEKELQARKMILAQVFLCTVNDSGDIFWVKKE